MQAIIVVLVVLWAMTNTACQTTPSAPSTTAKPKYQLNLVGNVDGVDFIGQMVGSSNTGHQITITSANNVDYFTAQSCTRSVQFNNVITSHWYTWGTNSFTWDYYESLGLEDSGDCPLRFCAFTKDVGSPPVSCAVVDWANNKYSLPGNNICNGGNYPNTGTAICHTQVGLIERFSFSVPVQTLPPSLPPTAPAGTTPYLVPGQCDGKFIDSQHEIFEYVVPEQECTVIFDEIGKPHRRAKLLVIPYDTNIYPGQ